MKKRKAYDIRFPEALAEMMKGKYIQGDDFCDGLYAALDDTGVAAIFNAAQFCRRTDNLLLTDGLYRQRFRVFEVAHEAFTDQGGEQG